MKTISSRQHPLVRRFKDAADRRGEPGDLLLDGPHLVREALGQRISIEVVALTPAARDDREVAALLPALAYAGADIIDVSEPVMAVISPVRTPTGIVALGRHAPAGIADLFTPPPALVAALVGVQDPGNVGAIVRAAAGAGATGVAVAEGSAHPFGWKALRGSQGMAFRLPVAGPVAAADAIAAARRAGARVLATVPRGGRAMYEVDLRRPCLVLLGGEGPGLDAGLVDAADARVEIPMATGVESLNVSVAAGVLLFEARRQRTVGSRGPA